MSVLLNTGVVTFFTHDSGDFPLPTRWDFKPGADCHSHQHGHSGIDDFVGDGSRAFRLERKLQGEYRFRRELRVSCQVLTGREGSHLGNHNDRRQRFLEASGYRSDRGGYCPGLFTAGTDFPSQGVGTESLPQTVTLTNTGSTQLRISQLLIHGNYQNFGEANTCARSVDPGTSCTITVKFRSTVTGLRKAYAEITDDGGGSPQRVMLTGTGK